MAVQFLCLCLVYHHSHCEMMVELQKIYFQNCIDELYVVHLHCD